MEISIKPEERDIPGIIRVLKSNIRERHGGLWKPDVCLTKGEMAFLVEVLEQHLPQEEPSVSTKKKK